MTKFIPWGLGFHLVTMVFGFIPIFKLVTNT